MRQIRHLMPILRSSHFHRWNLRLRNVFRPSIVGRGAKAVPYMSRKRRGRSCLQVHLGVQRRMASGGTGAPSYVRESRSRCMVSNMTPTSRTSLRFISSHRPSRLTLTRQHRRATSIPLRTYPHPAPRTQADTPLFDLLFFARCPVRSFLVPPRRAVYRSEIP